MEIRWFDKEMGETQVLLCCEDEVEECMQWVRDKFGCEPYIFVDEEEPLH